MFFICKVNKYIVAVFLCIRHHDEELAPIGHQDGQCLLRREGLQAGQQPVAVFLLLNLEKFVVGECDFLDVLDRETFLREFKLLSQCAQQNASLSGDGEGIAVICEVYCIDNTKNREGLCIKLNILHFTTFVGFGIEDLGVLRTVLEVDGLDFAVVFFCNFDGIFLICDIDSNSTVFFGLNFLTIFPDCDVKETCFRNTLFYFRLGLLQTFFILVRILLELFYLQLSAIGNFRISLIGQENFIALPLILIFELTSRKNRFLFCRCCCFLGLSRISGFICRCVLCRCILRLLIGTVRLRRCRVLCSGLRSFFRRLFIGLLLCRGV